MLICISSCAKEFIVIIPVILVNLVITTNPNFVGNVGQFKRLLDELRSNRFFNERIGALKLLLERELHDRAKAMIFATCPDTADQIYNILSSNLKMCVSGTELTMKIGRHLSKTFKAILVCDETAEEV